MRTPTPPSPTPPVTVTPGPRSSTAMSTEEIKARIDAMFADNDPNA